MSGEYRVTTLGGTLNLPPTSRSQGTPSPPPLRRWFSSAPTIPYILPRQHRRRFGYYASRLSGGWFRCKSFLFQVSVEILGIFDMLNNWRSIRIMNCVSVRVKAWTPTLPFTHKLYHFGQQGQGSLSYFLIR